MIVPSGGLKTFDCCVRTGSFHLCLLDIMIMNDAVAFEVGTFELDKDSKGDDDHDDDELTTLLLLFTPYILSLRKVLVQYQVEERPKDSKIRRKKKSKVEAAPETSPERHSLAVDGRSD